MKEFAEHLLEETIYELTSLKDSFEDGLLYTSGALNVIFTIKSFIEENEGEY